MKLMSRKSVIACLDCSPAFFDAKVVPRLQAKDMEGKKVYLVESVENYIENLPPWRHSKNAADHSSSTGGRTASSIASLSARSRRPKQKNYFA